MSSLQQFARVLVRDLGRNFRLTRAGVKDPPPSGESSGQVCCDAQERHAGPKAGVVVFSATIEPTR